MEGPSLRASRQQPVCPPYGHAPPRFGGTGFSRRHTRRHHHPHHAADIPSTPAPGTAPRRTRSTRRALHKPPVRWVPPRFTHKELAQRGSAACPRTHSWREAEPGPRPSYYLHRAPSPTGVSLQDCAEPSTHNRQVQEEGTGCDLPLTCLPTSLGTAPAGRALRRLKNAARGGGSGPCRPRGHLLSTKTLIIFLTEMS